MPRGWNPLNSWQGASIAPTRRGQLLAARTIRKCLSQPKQFTTTARCQAIAAPEIDFSKDSSSKPSSDALLRVVPSSPSYFTGAPSFTDNFLALQALLRKYQTLPVVPPGSAPRVAWKTLAQYRLTLEETVRAAKYHKVIQLLHRLNHIEPSMMPPEVLEALQSFKRNVNQFDNVPKLRTLDRYGRAHGVGRRKSSTARVWLVEGDGEVLINGKSLTGAFPRLHDRESAIWALKSTGRVDKYNVWALVEGGGLTGQAEAMTLAVAKALLIHEPALKPALRRAGCVTRDPRRVERKKPGRVKARKMPTWVKR